MLDALYTIEDGSGRYVREQTGRADSAQLFPVGV
jgi:hypothetical protein